jgi:hypothetical protein
VRLQCVICAATPLTLGEDAVGVDLAFETLEELVPSGRGTRRRVSRVRPTDVRRHTGAQSSF